MQFIEVTERDTKATMIVGLRYIRCIEKDPRHSGAILFLDGEEDGVRCYESYEAVRAALASAGSWRGV